MRKSSNALAAILAAGLLAASPAATAQSADDLEMMQTFLDIMTDYRGLIEATHDISSDPEKAAILQMQKIKEAFEERGEKARAADMLRQVLENSRNPSIRNAAYILLGDILKETGRTDEAVELLRRGLAENIEATN